MKRLLALLLMAALALVGSGCLQTGVLTSTTAQTSEYAGLFTAMFPELQFTSIEDNIAVTEAGETYYIEQLVYGKFTGSDNQKLVLVRRPPEELAHAAGFYHAYAAVFNSNNQLITPPRQFVSDQGSINVFSGAHRDYVFFAGSTTFQGWTSWSGGLYAASAEGWQQLWPETEDYWEHRAVQVGQDRLLIYRRVIHEGDSLIPEYSFEIETELFWDSEAECFVEKR